MEVRSGQASDRIPRSAGAPGGPGRPAVPPSRAFAAAFDGLVRAARAHGAAAPQLARRMLDLWEAAPSVRLRLSVQSLFVDDEECLAAGDSEGRWLLPCFLAGVRNIALCGKPEAAGMLRLAEEIGLLEPVPESIAAFRDWVWAEGATGFDVQMDASCLEVMEAADAGVSWEDWSAEAVRSLDQAMAGRGTIRVGECDVDATALREPFRMSLMALLAEAGSGHRTLTEAQARELQQGCDIGVAWDALEMDAVLQYPELRNTIPPERLGQRIVTLFLGGCDNRLLQFLTALSATDDAHSKAVLATLEDEHVGGILARHVELEGTGASSLGQCLLRAPRCLSSGLMHGILERCAAEPDLLGPLTRAAAHGGVERMVAVLDPAAMTVPQAVVLARVLSGPGVRDGGKIGDRFGKTCQTPVRCALLAGLPCRDLVAHSRSILKLLRHAGPEEGGPLRDTLAAAREPAAVALLGQALQQSRGKGWSARSLHAACEALVATPTGSEVLASLAVSTAIGAEVRLACLRALDRRPEVLRRISRWSLREMLLDPPAVKEMLREARQRNRGAEGLP